MQYEPGVSGNPAGRPKGIKDKRVALRELLTPHAEGLVAKVVEMALEGDAAALRICLDRLIPPIKGKDTAIELPDLPGSLAEKGRSVIDRMAAGELSPDEAGAVMQTLATHARIVEIDEIEQRLRALEEKSNEKLSQRNG